MTATTYAQTVTRTARAIGTALANGTVQRTDDVVHAAQDYVREAADASGVGSGVAIGEFWDEIEAQAQGAVTQLAGLTDMIQDQYRWAIRRGERPAGHLAEFLFYVKYGFQRFDTDAYELYEKFVEELREAVELRIQNDHELSLRFSGDC